MFQTGLLILTRPIPVLRHSLQNVLTEVSKTISNTLYVHIQPCSNNNKLFRITRTPYNTEIRNFITEFYAASASTCTCVDVRILLGHISNNSTFQWDVSYSWKNECDVVLFDNSSWVVNDDDSSTSNQTRQHLKQKFFTNTTSDPVIDNIKCWFDVSKSISDVDDSEGVVTTYDYSALGGTFDRIHAGHKILLGEGCALSNQSLTVGVTDSSMNHKKTLMELISPVEDRVLGVKEFISDVRPNITPNVVPIYDMFGPTITDPKLQCIVLSQETKKGGQIINEERAKKNMGTLEEYVIPMIEDKYRNEYEETKISSSSQRKRMLGTVMYPIKEKNIPASPYVVGLTGGIASGKSSISKRLEGLGAATIDCDKLGHKVYVKDTPTYNKLVSEFGQTIVAENGEVNRRALGAIVFSDPEKLKLLNKIVWPEIGKLAAEKIEGFRQEGRQVVVLEAALLLEAAWDYLVHEVWTAIIPENEAIKRMKERNNLSEEEAKKRLKSQLSNQNRVDQSHVILCTLWEYEYTQKQVEKAWSLLQERLTKANL